MRSIPLAIRATRELGLGSMTTFALYEFQRMTGWLRFRTPMKSWEAIRLEDLVRDGVPTDPEAYSVYRLGTERSFFFDPLADLSETLRRELHGRDESLLSEADEILKGQFRLFGGLPVNYGAPPDWHTFPSYEADPSPANVDLNAHWTVLHPNDFAQDIKLLWEPSRFGWTYVLGRAFRLTGEAKYAEGFWQLSESWREQNPPNRGPHWISAQEVAIRLMALVFSLYAFHPYLAEDPRRIVKLMETIASHADRIPSTLLYSRAQGNNHLILEAVGLYTAGLMFPEMRQAAGWRAAGRRWFEKALLEQVFPDGGYIQHSNNYHRLALEAALWAGRLAQLNGDDFCIDILEAIRRSSSCLGSMVVTSSGRVPNFGPNDGALLLPLTTCSFHDYRPAIQLATRILSMEAPFAAGPWDEASFWFGFNKDYDATPSKDETRQPESKEASESGPRREGASPVSFLDRSMGSTIGHQSFPQAGLYFLGGDETWGMFRCAKFSHRPGHSDQLHLDLWWRGENIGRDAGTYLYNGTPPWQNGLASANVHNTAIVDGMEPMSRAGRFLWLNWAQGTLLRYERSDDGILEYLCGEHDGYKAMGLRMVRSIIRGGDDSWMVVDDLVGGKHHTLCCGWLLPDTTWEASEATLRLDLPQGQATIRFDSPVAHWALYRAGMLIAGDQFIDRTETFGWFSPTYAIKEPALFFTASIAGPLPLRLISLWRLGGLEPVRLKVDWDKRASGQTDLSRIRYDQAVLDL